MSDDLFPDSMQDSPKVIWMKRHAIQVKDDEIARVEGGKIAFSLSNPQWETGVGSDEGDAIADFARRNNMKLWNE